MTGENKRADAVRACGHKDRAAARPSAGINGVLQSCRIVVSSVTHGAKLRREKES